jgi:DNA-binding transcriptional ArsR family regulator
MPVRQEPRVSKIWTITRRLNIALGAVFIFAIIMSSVAIIHAFLPSVFQIQPPPLGPTGPPSQGSPGPLAILTVTVSSYSLPLSVGGWIALAGLLVWRGRVRSIWTNLGFDQDVFKLFVRMRGAPTRLKLLHSLTDPKDRLQLAEELGIDWKAVDRHIQVLEKYGFIKERETQGTAKFFELSPSGSLLLKLIEEEKSEAR